MKLTLITGNQSKVREFERLLDITFTSRAIDLPEIQETDVSTVAKIKAEAAYAVVKQPLIVDDSGLYVHAWGQLPGALSVWFVENVGPEGLLKMLEGWDDRSAHVETVLGYCDEHGSKVFLGSVQGSIALEPQGTNGLGYDKIFVPTGSDRTVAELTPEEKDAMSARSQAVAKLHAFLKDS